MRTVCLLNKKGGVGKTSTCHHVGGTLAARGLKVLLVDADPQASLTQGLLGPAEAERLDPRATIAAILDPAADWRAGDLPRPTAFERLELVAGHEAAGAYNEPLPQVSGDRQFYLREALEALAPRYDLCLIDCPPHIQMWAWSALVAADGVVVPLQAEDYGAQGVRAVLRAVDEARVLANGRLALLGFVLTMFNRSLTLHASYERFFRDQFPAHVFEQVVPLAKDFKEAVACRKPVAAYKPRSAAARAIAALADELLARLDAMTPGAGHGLVDSMALARKGA